MAVLAIVTAPKCTLCQHARRTDIDALLERRARRESDGGRRINLEYVCDVFRAWGVYTDQKTETINGTIKTHWRKHCEVVSVSDDGTVTTEQEEMIAQAKELLERDPANFDLEGALRWVAKTPIAEAMARVARGEKSGITMDHALKAAQELTRRGQNEAQGDLLKAIIGGVGKAFGHELIEGVKSHKALPAPRIDYEPDGELVDAELVETPSTPGRKPTDSVKEEE